MQSIDVCGEVRHTVATDPNEVCGWSQHRYPNPASPPPNHSPLDTSYSVATK
jgi:hypothetical protein